MNIENKKKKIKFLEEQIKRMDNNSMIKIRIHGVVKRRISQVIETPIDEEMSVNEYLFRGNKQKKDFIEQVKNSFPKGSVINVEEIKPEEQEK